MPTYDYLCSACGHRFEEFHSMTAKPLRKCPECKKAALDRLIGAGAGVIFKGSGFYQTDYKNSGKPPSDSSDSGGKDSGGRDSGGRDSGGGDSGGKNGKADGRGCAPTCGTDSAPAGCGMNKAKKSGKE